MKLRIIGCALLKALEDIVTSEGGMLFTLCVAVLSYFVVPYFGILSILIIPLIERKNLIYWCWPPLILSIGSFLSWYYFPWDTDAKFCAEAGAAVVAFIAIILSALCYGIQEFIKRVKLRYRQCEVEYRERKRGE